MKHAPNRKYNFIKSWSYSKKHQEYTFCVSKDFYAYAVAKNLNNITRDLYKNWLCL
jgi:hypothetical protein